MNHSPWTTYNRLFVVGINFKKADVAHRNKFAIPQERARITYKETTSDCLQHFFILSTCNRTEIYGLVPCEYILLHFLKSCTQGSLDEIHQLGYVKEGDEAVEHFMNVASGLDSQIPGDYEIISQIKGAFQLAKEYGRIDGYLERLVNQGLQVSKIVKNTTSFSDGTLSVSYAVTQQIRNTGLTSPTICVVGLGEIGMVTLKNIRTYLPQATLRVVNRNEVKLQQAARTFGAAPYLMDAMKDALADTDIVIVCTAAQQPVVTASVLSGSQVKFIFDLSVPQNVAAEVYLDPCYEVMDIDAVSKEINKTVSDRLAEVPKVRQVVQEKAAEFIEWTGKRDFVTLVNTIQRELKPESGFSHKHISRRYAEHAAYYLGQPSRRKEILETLCVNSFQDQLQETAVRKVIASLETEVYAPNHTNDHKRKPSCFMANHCCHNETTGSGTPV